MLKRSQSINQKDFSYIYKRGRRIYQNNFVIIYLSNKKDFSQFAIIISTKVEKLATRRNWMRRYIKSIIKNHLSKIISGYYIVITLKKSFYKIDETEKIKKDLISALTKIT